MLEDIMQNLLGQELIRIMLEISNFVLVFEQFALEIDVPVTVIRKDGSVCEVVPCKSGDVNDLWRLIGAKVKNIDAAENDHVAIYFNSGTRIDIKLISGKIVGSLQSRDTTKLMYDDF